MPSPFNPGRMVTALGLTQGGALYFNCLPFLRFGDNTFIPLSTHLLAVPNCVQGGTHSRPNGAAETPSPKGEYLAGWVVSFILPPVFPE